MQTLLPIASGEDLSTFVPVTCSKAATLAGVCADGGHLLRRHSGLSQPSSGWVPTTWLGATASVARDGKVQNETPF